MLLEQVLGRGFSAALGLKGGESSLSWIAGIFFKDAVCIDRFSDDALAKKKNQCPSDCTRKGSRLVKKLQQAYWEMDFFCPPDINLKFFEMRRKQSVSEMKN